MKRAPILSTLALLAAAATPAGADWRWVDDAPEQRETYVYEQPAQTETRVYEAPRTDTYVYQEERRAYPQGPAYYQEEPRTYYREEYRPAPVVVTDREVFADGGCEITRTHMSDGTYSDERICSRPRIVPPHVFIRDRVHRHLDWLFGD